MKASIDSFETFGLVDGPGIRTVIFFNGCSLRCKYCHNPEMFIKKEDNYTIDEVVNKVLRSKPYFKDKGGVTFSGGEALLQAPFILELAKKLHKEGINNALDTAGVGLGNYDELLNEIDLVLLDIKHTDKDKYKLLTGRKIEHVEEFIDALNRSGKKVWIRQVIVPNMTDTTEYMDSLVEYLKHIKNIERVDFLPFHRLGREKYIRLGLDYPMEEYEDFSKEESDKLYSYFMDKFNKEYK